MRFIDKIFSTLQPNIFNDKNLFIEKLLRLQYGHHCKSVLIKNLQFLFEAFPVFYEMTINFILNIKPSEKQKFQLLFVLIITKAY